LKGEKNNTCNNPDMIKTKSTNLIMGFDYKKDDPRYKKIVKKMDENRLAKEKISDMSGVQNFYDKTNMFDHIMDGGGNNGMRDISIENSFRGVQKRNYP
jgi:hypothetical protein